MAINIGDQYLQASECQRYRVMSIQADIYRIVSDMDFMGNIIWRKISNSSTSGGGSWMGSTYYPKDGRISYEHEYIMLFRKHGKCLPPSEELKEKSRLTKEQRSKWFRGIWEDVNPERQKDHPAAFPIELPARLIRMYSFCGETVCDPFMGSGSTAVAAELHGRNSIGFELNSEFVEMAKSRIEMVGGNII